MTIIKMEKLLFGEIVLLKFPFTKGKIYKKRPALLLRDTEDNDIVVCRITSKLYETEFDVEVKHWKKCGLKLPSVVRLHKIATLEKKIIEQKIGLIDNSLKKQVKEKFAKLIK